MSKALASGSPLAALRSIGAACRTPTNIYFLESKLLAAAQSNPDLFAPEAARADVARLRRDRRAARPALDATRAALMRDPSLYPWRDGAHVSAVGRGLLSQRQAMELARAARDAWAFLARPEVRAGHACSKQEVQAAFDACVLGRLGRRLLHVAGGCSAPEVAPRAVSIEVVNRVLRLPGYHGGVAMLLGARRVPWTAETHPFVCDGATRQVVRGLLTHFCRHFGLYTGAEVAMRVFALVFKPPGSSLRAPAPRGAGFTGTDPFLGEEAALPYLARIEATPKLPPPIAAAAPRVRFGFLLQPGDAQEARTCAN